MKKTFFPFSSLEKILLLCFGAGFFFSLFGVAWSYYQESSDITVAYGGTYTEGVIASASDLSLNPVFIYGHRDQSVESDVVSMLFSGLMKFNAKTGVVEDYIASHTLSADKKVYTFRLKEGLLWHDGAPLTADDVIFTYRDVISHEDFTNDSLKRAFSSVEIKKVNDLEVSFTLQYPYKFFLTNFTVGILPKHILENIPVSEMEYSDFSAHPIGSGPFKYESLDEIRPNIFKLTLSAFRESSLSDPKLDTVEFIMYPSRNSLSLDSHNLDGIRPFATKDKDLYFIDSKLQSENSFALPQYSALFFNLKKDIFKGESGYKLRTGLRLATDKESLMNEVPSVRIDTPLLEIKKGEWEFEYDPQKANGAFKDAGYYFPSKKPKTVIPENSQEKWITRPTRSAEWVEKGSKVEVMGIFPAKGRSLKLFWKQMEGDDLSEKELWYHEKQNRRIDNEEWKWDFEVKDEYLNKRGELRIKFYDNNKKFIKEDAISWYWENDEKNIKNTEKTEENNAENNKTNKKKDEKKDVKKGEEKGEENTENNTKENNLEKNEEKAFDLEKKNATNEGEISLEKIIDQDEMRETLDGKPLKLTLLTSDQPAYYGEVANHLKKDWKSMGLELEVKVLPLQEFYEAVSHREYDILLYGQNLGYNLDIYEFFHGSQVGKGNLSEYKSQQANVLIQEIRSSHVPEVRAKKLQQLDFALKRDIPAIFLFSPTYEYYHNQGIKGVEIPSIAFLRDRFSNIDEWYIENDRSFKENESWGGFPHWFTQKYISFITFSL